MARRRDRRVRGCRQLQAAGGRRHRQGHQPLVHVVGVGGGARRDEHRLGDVAVRGADAERRPVRHRVRGRRDLGAGALEQVGRREDLDLVALAAAEVIRAVVARRHDAAVRQEQRRRVVAPLLVLGRHRRPGVGGRVVAQRLFLGEGVVVLEVAPDGDHRAVRGQDRVGVAALLWERGARLPAGAQVRPVDHLDRVGPHAPDHHHPARAPRPGRQQHRRALGVVAPGLGPDRGEGPVERVEDADVVAGRARSPARGRRG